MRQPSKDVIAHYVYAKYRRIDREYMAWNPFAPPEKPFPAKAINEGGSGSTWHLKGCNAV